MKPNLLSQVGLTLAAILLAGHSWAATPEPPTRAPVRVSVDARVELISLIFRLAGNSEYNRAAVSGYARDADKHFASHRNHAVVQQARKLRSTRGVSFDAPMSLAIHLTVPPDLKERVPLEPKPAGLDGRWPADQLPVFLDQARQFVNESDFKGFVVAHKELYDLTTQRAEELLKEARLDWFDTFFGARPGARFKLVVALLNGPNNYGARIRVGGEEELYCVLGAWQTDWRGNPKFDRSMLDTVAHEFCHSYVNPLVYARTKELEEPGRKLFSQVQQRMTRMAYGNWTTMIHESVVRASVVRYLHATQGAEAAEKQVRNEMARGFLWMEELAPLLARYEGQRKDFPTLEAFFPKVIEFFRDYARKQPPGG